MFKPFHAEVWEFPFKVDYPFEIISEDCEKWLAATYGPERDNENENGTWTWNFTDSFNTISVFFMNDQDAVHFKLRYG